MFDTAMEIARLAADLDELELYADAGGGIESESFAAIFVRFRRLVRAGVRFAPMFVQWIDDLQRQVGELEGEADEADELLDHEPPVQLIEDPDVAGMLRFSDDAQNLAIAIAFIARYSTTVEAA